MDVVRIPLPDHLVNSHARWWYGQGIHFVLIEEVCDWLGDQDIIADIEVHYPKRECLLNNPDSIAYQLILDSMDLAVLFKLRWF